MKQEPADPGQNILNGLSFLMNEAEQSGLAKVARLINICIRDVGLVMDASPSCASNQNAASDESLFCAIKFLTHFYAIKDSQVKRAFLSEIESREFEAEA